jgi:hypothetical protein
MMSKEIDWNDIDWRTEARANRVAAEATDGLERRIPGSLRSLGWAGIAALESEIKAAWYEDVVESQ